jgi:uncharacterized protein RhaS with RHS repeats
MSGDFALAVVQELAAEAGDVWEFGYDQDDGLFWRRRRDGAGQRVTAVSVGEMRAGMAAEEAFPPAGRTS